jgi:Peptidase family M1 domain
MNRWFLIIVALACFVTCGGTSQAAGPPEITRQLIDVSIAATGGELRGESTITLNPHGMEGLSLDLYPSAVVSLVSVAGREVPFRFSGGTLFVELWPGQRRQTVQVRIGYRAVFNDTLPALSAGMENPGFGVNAIIAPDGVFLGSGVAWYPRPSATPLKRTLTITTLAGIEAVSAGMRREHRSEQGMNRSVWEEAHPVENLSLSAGRYVIAERTAGKLPLYTYFSPANAHLSDAYLEAAATWLKIYQKLFGPYPFEKFAIVENFLPTGYGFPSYTLLGGDVIRLPFILTTSLPHEIAHNWWGNGLLVDYREGNWSEGLVTYLADYLLEERKSPVAGRDYRFRILTDYAELVPPSADFPLSAFVSRADPASRAIGYGKGAMVFHMIRTRIGDRAFFGALRDLCRERMYRPATWDDLIRAFSRSSGRDIGTFVKPWLERPGGPRLSLADVAVKPAGRTWRVTGRVKQAPPFWPVLVTLLVETASGPRRIQVASDGVSSSFNAVISEAHGRVLLDPDADLFRILPPEEIPPAINSIKGSRHLTVIITRNCQADRGTLQKLLESLGQGGARTVREDGIERADLAGHDLLVCGIPERRDLLAPLPGTITVDSGGFSIDGRKFTSQDDSLVAVTRNPVAPEHAAALYFPLSKAAAAAAVRKITHYGKYGFLAFTGAENRARGLLTTTGGGSAADF